LELGSGRVHVRDHGADVTDDGGEDQNADQEVDRHKQVFNILKIGFEFITFLKQHL
jgi:hypothetical protein